MELKQYVQEVISQIADAICEINAVEPENKTIVNPAFSDIQEYQGHLICVLERSDMNGFKKFCKIVDVNFDVTLTSASKSEAGGGVKLSVIGVGGSTGNENAATNRVTFSLPVLFPSAKQPHN